MTLPANATTQTISVTVTDIQTIREGNLMVMLFEKDGFSTKHEKAAEIKTVKANKSEMTFNFNIVSEKVYAIKVLHDEDYNGKTSKNWTGIVPREGLGFSNDARLSITGPPSFKKAMVNPDQLGDEIVVAMRYPNKPKKRSKGKR